MVNIWFEHSLSAEHISIRLENWCLDSASSFSGKWKPGSTHLQPSVSRLNIASWACWNSCCFKATTSAANSIHKLFVQSVRLNKNSVKKLTTAGRCFDWRVLSKTYGWWGRDATPVNDQRRQAVSTESLRASILTRDQLKVPRHWIQCMGNFLSGFIWKRPAFSISHVLYERRGIKWYMLDMCTGVWDIC